MSKRIAMRRAGRGPWHEGGDRNIDSALVVLLAPIVAIFLVASTISVSAAEPAARRTDLVIAIDNSRSIRPHEQVIIREATMLLGDLADPGDRISVVTFGEEANTVVSMSLNTATERRAFKDAVQSGVDFDERLSDIRAGIALVADNYDQFFPAGAAQRVLMVFSDGKLEPRGERAEVAFSRIKEDLAGPLADVDIYPVVLGDTFSRHPIPGLTHLTGFELMCGHVARSPESCYHAIQLDQLLEVTFAILSRVKEFPSLGEEAGLVFRIDDTVDMMTLIVRKRDPRAPPETTLPASAQIALKVPPDSLPTPNESISRNDKYHQFDLFVVRNPRPGIWRVAVAEGTQPIVLSKVTSPIRLIVRSRVRYFSNEVATLEAWLHDDRTGAPWAAEYTLQAHVGPQGGLAASTTYAEMRREDATSVFELAVPAAFLPILDEDDPAGLVDLEVVAKRQADPWFLRRSAPSTIEIAPPLIEWMQVPLTVTPLPTQPVVLVFGGEMAEVAYRHIGFELPPILTLIMQRRDDNGEVFVPFRDRTTRPTATDGSLIFRLAEEVSRYGEFRYRYRLAGDTPQGPLVIESPAFGVAIEFFWQAAVGVAIAFVMSLQALSAMTAKLRGTVRTEATGPQSRFSMVPVHPARSFSSAAIKDPDLGRTRFRIQAKRYLFLIKRLRVRMLAGTASLDQQAIGSGQSRSIRPRGPHELRLVREDGTPITVTLNLHV